MGHAIFTLSSVALLWGPSLVWLAYGTLRPEANPYAPDWRQRAPRGLWLVLFAPFLVSLWAALLAGAGEGQVDAPAPAWPLAILHGLAASQLVLAVAALYRYRRAWPFAVPTVAAALAYTAVAWFIGVMAITNDWL